MNPLESAEDAVGTVTLAVGNLVAWLSHTEQIWYPMFGAISRYLAPVWGLPDLRGPLAFLTLVYLGFRIGDMLDERDEVIQ